MTRKDKRVLRPIGSAELSTVRGGAMLIPAVQKVRDAAGPLQAGDVYIKFGDITGEADG
jgi:hypothetical protein